MSDGWLINVQAGRGDNYRIVADNEGDKGAWGPRNEVSRDAVECFVYFCMNDAYIDMRKAITNRYPGQVIPFVPVPHSKGEKCSWNTYGVTDDGFGTMVHGYAHWVGGEKMCRTHLGVCRGHRCRCGPAHQGGRAAGCCPVTEPVGRGEFFRHRLPRALRPTQLLLSV